MYSSERENLISKLNNTFYTSFEGRIFLSGIPFLIGVSLYLLTRECNHMIFFRAFGLEFHPVIKAPEIVKFILPDFLWMLSIVLFLRIVIQERRLLPIITLFLLVAVLEFSQLIENVPGTFDLLDLMAYFLATLLTFLKK